MAMLRYFPQEGSPVFFAVHKPVMTIGRALGNDVHIPDRSVKEHHAQIVFNGRDFQLEELDRIDDIAIEGKKERTARLVDVDRLELGIAQLGVRMCNEMA